LLDREARCVNNCFRLRGFEIANTGDAITTNGNIDVFRFGAGAVLNRAAFNDYVVPFTVNQPTKRQGVAD
jgi:hypothetical protein